MFNLFKKKNKKISYSTTMKDFLMIDGDAKDIILKTINEIRGTEIEKKN